MTVAFAPHLRRPGFFVTIAALTAIALATLLPEPGTSPSSHLCLACGSLGGVDAILNIALFVPLGVGLALSGVRGRNAVLSACALSVIIEIAQLFIPGRDATIGDVLTNTLGSAIGFGAGRYTSVWLRPSPRVAATLAVVWSLIWLAIQGASDFAFVPAIPDARYYGQIARSLGNRAVFHGRVISARIDDIVIPNTAFADSRPVQRLLRDGASIAATLVPAVPTPGNAPIVRVADSDQREILLLAQDGTSLVFGIRTGAAVLRLRPPLFSIPAVFPAARGDESMLSRDSLHVSARYSAREVGLSAGTTNAIHQRLFHPAASLGWTLVLPFQWLIEGTRWELLLGWIWTACLSMPLGFWGACLTRLPRSRPDAPNPAVVGLAALVVLWTGFIVLPHAAGVASGSLSEWLSAITGLFTGTRMGGRVVSAPTLKKPVG